MRIRALVVAPALVLAMFVPVGPAGAAAGPKSVAGSFRGAGGFLIEGTCALLVDANAGHYHATHLGDGTFTFNFCVTSTSPLHVKGTLEFVTAGGGQVHGTLDADLLNGLTGIPVTIHGGTKRFANATGGLLVDLHTFDETNCDPRDGICFNWRERGKITGTIEW